MELKIVIDENAQEQVVVYTHKISQLVNDIEELVNSSKADLIGFSDDEAVKLNINEIICFLTEDNKVFALTDSGKFKLKCRLYQLEENLNCNFIKINQSCIANIKKISRFKATIGGALNVIFVNGYSDYVSRRNIKNIKERFRL